MIGKLCRLTAFPEGEVRIEGPSRAAGSGARGVGRTGATGGERFTLTPEPAASAVANAAGPAAAGALDALLALQTVDDPLLAKKKSLRRGHALLDGLEAIKADLLVGRVSEGRLNRIMALVGQARGTAEPGLNAIIEEIELRARVELAKLEVAR